MPDLAVWLNANDNKAIAEKQDKELLFKGRKTGFHEDFVLITEKALTYVSPIEYTIFYTSKHVGTFPKVCL